MAVPIAPIIQGVAGIAQAIGGGIQAKRAENKLEKMVNNYKPNESIMDYYNKALSRYNVNPYTSNLFNMQKQAIDRNVASGVNSLQSRRGAVAGINSLVQSANDGYLKAAATAEGQQAQALGQLGQATGMKAQEQFKPFEMKFNLLSQKAGGGNQIMNAGLGNIFGGASAYNDYKMIDKIYGK
jgi:hypothetical protein